MRGQGGRAPHKWISIESLHLRFAPSPPETREKLVTAAPRMPKRWTLGPIGAFVAASALGCASAGTASTTATGPAGAAPTELPVMFNNGPVVLRGTLFMPAGAFRHPAVVIAHGLGAEGRAADRELALAFARNGFAALTYDNRGVGESTGDWRRAAYSDMASDAIYGIGMLGMRPDIDPARIGLFARGQGATMSPMVAERNAGLPFIIAVSPVGVDHAETSAATDTTSDVRMANFAPALHWEAVSGAVMLVFGAGEPGGQAERSRTAITRALGNDPRVFASCTYPGPTASTVAHGDDDPPLASYVDDVMRWARVAARLVAAPAQLSAACK